MLTSVAARNIVFPCLVLCTCINTCWHRYLLYNKNECCCACACYCSVHLYGAVKLNRIMAGLEQSAAKRSPTFYFAIESHRSLITPHREQSREEKKKTSSYCYRPLLCSAVSIEDQRHSKCGAYMTTDLYGRGQRDEKVIRYLYICRPIFSF